MSSAPLCRQFGRVNILFNNAGIVPTGKLESMSEEEWDRAMAINVKSMYLFCHAVIPDMKAQGGGVILNTASATALRAVWIAHVTQRRKPRWLDLLSQWPSTVSATISE